MGILQDKSELKGKSGIYMILCLVTGKFYIGSASDFCNRRKSHLCNLNKKKHSSPHMQNAWEKYGEKEFVFVCLELCPKDTLCAKEQEYLDIYTPFDNNIGYNICPKAYSRRGVKSSLATKERNRIVSTGLYGLDYELVSPDGMLHRERGIKTLAKKYMLSPKSLTMVVRGKLTHSAGWHLPNVIPTSPVRRFKRDKTDVYRFIDPDNKIVEFKRGELYPKGRELGLSPQGIEQSLDQKIGSYRGWRRCEEETAICSLP